MKKVNFLLLCIILISVSCQQKKYRYFDKLEFKKYKIGDKVDTTLFQNEGKLYFPNYLDGWTMKNTDQLPDKYKGLPIAIWQLKSDPNIVLTLLDNIILNITISNITVKEKDDISKLLKEKFGFDGKKQNYEESHPLQSWITYWILITWETKDVVVQIGNNNMRKPDDDAPKEEKWNLVYTDFIQEDKVITLFKNSQLTKKSDSLKAFK